MNWRWKIAQWVERRWWQRYLRKQSVEDYLRKKKAYWQRILTQVDCYPSKEARILDAGCGPAGIFMLLQNDNLVALDPLVAQYEQDLAHFDSAWYPNVSFRAEQLEQFQTVEPFDLVFCLNAINHVEDIQKAMRRLAQATKVDGLLFLSTDAHNSPFLKRVFQLLPGDILHPHQYDLEEYQAMTQKHGFEILETYCLKQNSIFNYYLIKAKKVTS